MDIYNFPEDSSVNLEIMDIKSFKKKKKSKSKHLIFNESPVLNTEEKLGKVDALNYKDTDERPKKNKKSKLKLLDNDFNVHPMEELKPNNSPQNMEDAPKKKKQKSKSVNSEHTDSDTTKSPKKRIPNFNVETLDSVAQLNTKQKKVKKSLKNKYINEENHQDEDSAQYVVKKSEWKEQKITIRKDLVFTKNSPMKEFDLNREITGTSEECGKASPKKRKKSKKLDNESDLDSLLSPDIRKVTGDLEIGSPKLKKNGVEGKKRKKSPKSGMDSPENSVKTKKGFTASSASVVETPKKTKSRNFETDSPLISPKSKMLEENSDREKVSPKKSQKLKSCDVEMDSPFISPKLEIESPKITINGLEGEMLKNSPEMGSEIDNSEISMKSKRREESFSKVESPKKSQKSNSSEMDMDSPLKTNTLEKFSDQKKESPKKTQKSNNEETNESKTAEENSDLEKVSPKKSKSIDVEINSTLNSAKSKTLNEISNQEKVSPKKSQELISSDMEMASPINSAKSNTPVREKITPKKANTSNKMRKSKTNVLESGSEIYSPKKPVKSKTTEDNSDLVMVDLNESVGSKSKVKLAKESPTKSVQNASFSEAIKNESFVIDSEVAVDESGCNAETPSKKKSRKRKASGSLTNTPKKADALELGEESPKGMQSSSRKALSINEESPKKKQRKVSHSLNGSQEKKANVENMEESPKEKPTRQRKASHSLNGSQEKSAKVELIEETPTKKQTRQRKASRSLVESPEDTEKVELIEESTTNKRTRKRKASRSLPNSPKKTGKKDVKEEPKKPTIDPAEFENLSSGDDCESSDDEPVTQTTPRKSQKLRQSDFSEKKRRNVKSFDVSTKRVCSVLDQLQHPNQEKNEFAKTCNFQMTRDYSWDSFTYILDHMRLCILTENWRNFYELLVLLMRHPGATSNLFKNYVKEMSFLKLLVGDQRGSEELLEQFYGQFFTTIREKPMKELEVWFRE